MCIAAGVPSLENANEILSQLRDAGLRHVAFKPGSTDSIKQVVAIAEANPEFPIILQWTGGRAGGHHSFEDFHQPLLRTYADIRKQKNIVLVAGCFFFFSLSNFPYFFLRFLDLELIVNNRKWNGRRRGKLALSYRRVECGL